MLTKFQAVRGFFQLWPRIMKSKTMITNIALLAVALATAALELEFIKGNEEIAAFLAATVIPVANMILRFFTVQPVSEKKSLWK